MTVHYRHHPRFGATLRVRRRWANHLDRGWIVELSDGTEGAIPTWMTDAVFCAALSEGPPQVGLASLLELVRLFDAGTAGDPLQHTAEEDHGEASEDATRAPVDRAAPTATAGSAGGSCEIARPASGRGGDRHDD